MCCNQWAKRNDNNWLKTINIYCLAEWKQIENTNFEAAYGRQQQQQRRFVETRTERAHIKCFYQFTPTINCHTFAFVVPLPSFHRSLASHLLHLSSSSAGRWCARRDGGLCLNDCRLIILWCLKSNLIDFCVGVLYNIHFHRPLTSPSPFQYLRDAMHALHSTQMASSRDVWRNDWRCHVVCAVYQCASFSDFIFSFTVWLPRQMTFRTSRIVHSIRYHTFVR